MLIHLSLWPLKTQGQQHQLRSFYSGIGKNSRKSIKWILNIVFKSGTETLPEFTVLSSLSKRDVQQVLQGLGHLYVGKGKDLSDEMILRKTDFPLVCCFDPRVDPTTFLGLKPWGKAPFITVLRICAGDTPDVSNNNFPITHLEELQSGSNG